MLGSLLKPENKLYRYSNYTPSAKMIGTLSKLVPADLGDRALFTEFVIKLLGCSHFWADFISAKDQNNTYSVDVVEFSPVNSIELLKDSPMKRLADWADRYTGSSADFPVSEFDPPLTKISAKLFSVLSDE